MDASSILVAVPNSRLATALAGALSEYLPGIVVDTGPVEHGAGGVVVTTPASCSPSECRRLALEGTRLIVISPMALLSERRLYEEAGAFAYLPMQIDATELIANAVKLALRHGHLLDGRDARTAFSQEVSPRPC
ncbi:MAG: hypothetical protein U0837_13540 [Dehalococcoidia bacterium]